MMQSEFSSNSSPKALNFCDVNMLWKFVGYRPQWDNFLHVPHSSIEDDRTLLLLLLKLFLASLALCSLWHGYQLDLVV